MVDFTEYNYNENRDAFEAKAKLAPSFGDPSTFSLITITTLSIIPGKVLCYASGQCKNRTRRLDIKQTMGRKVDELALFTHTRLELCIIEAAKKDEDVTCAKALSDTQKMAKEMKDTHDEIHIKATENIRYRLVTYDIGISGPTISLYTLRQRELPLPTM